MIGEMFNILQCYFIRSDHLYSSSVIKVEILVIINDTESYQVRILVTIMFVLNYRNRDRSLVDKLSQFLNVSFQSLKQDFLSHDALSGSYHLLIRLKWSS